MKIKTAFFIILLIFFHPIILRLLNIDTLDNMLLNSGFAIAYTLAAFFSVIIFSLHICDQSDKYDEESKKNKLTSRQINQDIESEFGITIK